MKLATITHNKMKVLIGAFSALLLGLFIGYLSSTTSAIPYTGDSTPASPVPAFNVYTGVPDEGDESNFFKGKVNGTTGASVNNVVSTCETGTQFKLRAYVHNGADEAKNNGGSGPSVAKNSKITVALPNGENTEFTPRATISATNASSVSDTMNITCSDGRVVTIKYVAGSAAQWTVPGGTKKLSDAIVTTGAPIGTNTPNGDVWGCWDQRVWVTLVVEVTEVPPQLHAAVCDALLTTMFASKSQVRVDDVEYTANDARVNNITISYGDGTNNTVGTNEFPQEVHTYATPGTYTVRATLNTTFEGSSKPISGPKCVAEITIEPEEETPVYACTDPRFVLEGRKASFSFIPTAKNGATFKNANILYFANGDEVNSDTTDVVNADGRVVSNYTFEENAVNVSANATLRFNVNDNVKEVKCAGEAVLGEVTPPTVTPTPPTIIPVTGAGGVAGILAAVTVIGAYAHRAMTLKRQ